MNSAQTWHKEKSQSADFRINLPSVSILLSLPEESETLYVTRAKPAPGRALAPLTILAPLAVSSLLSCSPKIACARALMLAFGRQAAYEMHTDDSDSQRQRLDLYLCERIRDRLNTWKEASEEEDSEFEEWEQHNTAFEREEGESTCYTFFVPVEEKARLLKLQRARE